MCLVCTNVFNALGRAAYVYGAALKHRECCQLHAPRLVLRVSKFGAGRTTQHIGGYHCVSSHWT